MNLFRIKNSADGVPNWVTDIVRDRIKNANVARQPVVYYGKHFSDGVAEYREEGKPPYRVLINADTAKKMDPSFEGCPLVVLHTDEELKEILPNIMEKADGFVVESFYNQADGCHWTKFLAITEAAHEAISKGWFLSNCYKIKNSGRGGMWQGIDYQNEVLEGKYEHLALVPNPRYDSIIFTPEEFKAYNAEKRVELERLTNSNDHKGDRSMFFKKQAVTNAKELEETMVELPKSKKQMTVKEAITQADVLQNMQGYASDDHMVKLNDSEELSVKDLKSKYNEMVEHSKKTEEAAEGEGDAAADAKFDNDDEATDDAAAEDANLDNMDEKKGDNKDGGEMGGKTKNGLTKSENALLEKLQKKANISVKNRADGLNHFGKLTNAADRAAFEKMKNAEQNSYDSERSQLQRGSDRYGSTKK